MSTEKQDVIEKLKKILARADTSRGATRAEMETAMRKAGELAAAHNLDLAAVALDAAKDGEKTDFETAREGAAGKARTMRPHHFPVHRVLKACFGVHVLYSGSYSSGITIIGEKVDVQMAKMVFGWLDELFPRLYREFLRENGLWDSAGHRNGFFEGLSLGIVKNNERIIERMNEETGGAYALVLADKEGAVAAALKAFCPNVKNVPCRSRCHDGFAASAGYQKGKTIKLSSQLETVS